MWHIAATLGLGGLFLGFSWLVLQATCQSVHEVRPDVPLLYLRLPFHLTLIFPDEVIYSGIVIALVASVTSGDLQMMHLWVNWDDAVPGLRGPLIPDWIKGYHRLHGLAWSTAGLLTGASLTWLVRWVSHRILGYPALGFGDVTLMAMVGAFIGWQATLCVLAISPLAGIIIGMLVRLLTGRNFVAFGPYLASSAVLVMAAWRWLWADLLTVRDIFSHWPSVVGLIAFSFAVLCGLLFLLRIFRALPTERLGDRRPACLMLLRSCPACDDGARAAWRIRRRCRCLRDDGRPCGTPTPWQPSPGLLRSLRCEIQSACCIFRR